MRSKSKTQFLALALSMILTKYTKKTILAWFFTNLEGVLDSILTIIMSVKNMRQESIRSSIIILCVWKLKASESRLIMDGVYRSRKELITRIIKKNTRKNYSFPFPAKRMECWLSLLLALGLSRNGLA